MSAFRHYNSLCVTVDADIAAVACGLCDIFDKNTNRKINDLETREHFQEFHYPGVNC